MSATKDFTTRRLAVVTGASSGIGYELAKQFAEHDCDLIVAAEDAGIVESAQSLSQMGINAIPVRTDLATREGVEKLYETIAQENRPVDILALNAGVGVNGDFVRHNDLEEELNLVNLNVVSVVHLAKLVLPEMVERGEGKVLITSSIAALMPGPFYATYAASKSFLLSFSEALFNELDGTGVTVTALMPGATDTQFFARAGMLDTKAGVAEKDDPALVAKQAYEALMAGDDHLIAGSMKNKLREYVMPFLSEKQKAKIHRGEVEPHSATK